MVRSDYTDCYSGTVRYTVGETTTHPRADRRDVVCGVGLHLCRYPEDVLQFRNGQWPVRLLEVRSDDVIATDAIKVRCGSIHVVREIGLAPAFGPNGASVVELIDELPSIPWMKPSRPVSADLLQPLVDMHLSRLTCFTTCVQPLPVRIETDLDAAMDAAMDAAWDAVWAAAWAAAVDAGHRVVADLVSWTSPWAPLLDMWRLGCWPIGVVDGAFVVFVPKVA